MKGALSAGSPASNLDRTAARLRGGGSHLPPVSQFTAAARIDSTLLRNGATRGCRQVHASSELDVHARGFRHRR